MASQKLAERADAASGTIVAEDIERALEIAGTVVQEMCSRIPFEGSWDI